MNGTTTPRQKLSGVEESDIADSMQSGHGGAAYEASLDRQSFRRCKLHRAHGVRRKQEPRDSPSSRKKVKKKKKEKKKSRARNRYRDTEGNRKGRSEDTGSARQRFRSPNRVIRWVCGEPDVRMGQVRF